MAGARNSKFAAISTYLIAPHIKIEEPMAASVLFLGHREEHRIVGMSTPVVPEETFRRWRTDASVTVRRDRYTVKAPGESNWEVR